MNVSLIVSARRIDLTHKFFTDGLLGDVLFWALERCVGEDIYNHEMHIAWVKIYSRMLRTMVPMAVAHELRNGSAQAKRMSTYFGTYALSNSRTVSEESAAHVSSRTVE